MNTVRCPICQQYNPEGAEICFSCGARLKPLPPSAGAPEPPPAGDAGDWLQDLRSDINGAVSLTPDASETSQAQPAADAVLASGEDQEGIPEWLQRVRERARFETFATDTGPFEAEEAPPDWLEETVEREAPGDAGRGARAYPLPEVTNTSDATGENVAGETPAGDFYAWLDALNEDEEPDLGQDWPRDEVADRLHSQEADRQNEEIVDRQGEEPVGRSEDEFSAHQEDDNVGPLEDESRGSPEAEGELSAWTGGDEAAGSQAPENVLVETDGVETAGARLEMEMPGASPGEAPGMVEGAENAIEEPEPSRLSGPAPFIDETMPDWLKDFDDQPQPEGAPVFLENEEPPAGVEDSRPFKVDLPDWLSEEAEPDAVQEEPVAMEAGLSTLAPLEPREGEEAAGAGRASTVSDAPEESLAQAELPDWVKEIRPIESVMPDEVLPVELDQRVEKAGPLTGLRGVLRAEEAATRYRKPSAYSARLRVSEKQRSQAALLESLLAQETRPLQVPQPRQPAQRTLTRVLVALLLLVALAYPRLSHMAPLALPLLNPPELLEMFNGLDRPAQQENVRPVLLAVDYEPARAGEMMMASVPVVAHLMAQDRRIVVVSTVPTGPALAGRLLEQAAAGRTSYALQDRVANLGYLPGGTISLLEFSRYPWLAAPADVSGNYAVWKGAVLREVRGLTDFSQVIVLTDSAETGRAWVEQVRPVMGDIPLWMVTSAQAAPLLQPYLESRQVSGMVSGVLGGYLYGQRAGLANSAAGDALSAYQVGIGLAFLLLLGGGLFSAVRSLARRNDWDEDE